MSIFRIFIGINGQFGALCACASYTLQFGTLSRPSLDFVLTTIVVELINDETPASFRPTVSTPSLLYDRRDDELLDDPVLSIVSR